jgi:Ni/Co efflux regulator RcnB
MKSHIGSVRDLRQYMLTHPRDGQQWNIQFAITPVLSKLIQGVLVE